MKCKYCKNKLTLFDIFMNFTYCMPCHFRLLDKKAEERFQKSSKYWGER